MESHSCFADNEVQRDLVAFQGHTSLLLSTQDVGAVGESQDYAKSLSTPETIFCSGDLTEHITACCHFLQGEEAVPCPRMNFKGSLSLLIPPHQGSSGSVAQTTVKRIWDQKSPCLSGAPRGLD